MGSTTQASAAEGLRGLVLADDILGAARKLGPRQRQRKVDLTALVEATVAAVTPVAGTQTTTFASSIALTGQKLSPSAFYKRFSHAFGHLVRQVAGRAVEAMREVAGEQRPFNELGMLLREFEDVQVADWAPSTSEDRPAGVKWHTLLSLRDELPVTDALASQRTQDTCALP
jgi:hypothetical protein